MGTIRSTMSDREKLSDVVMSSLEGEMDVEAVEHAFADAKAAAARLRAEGKEEEAADLNQMVDCLEGAVEAHLMAEDLQKEAAAMARGDTASVPNRTCTTHEPVTHMDYSIRGNPMTVTLQEAPADEHIDGGDPSSWAPVSASCMDRMVRQPAPELPCYSGPILDADGNQIAFIEAQADESRDEHVDGGDPSSWAPVSAPCMDRMVRQPEPELPCYSGPILDADGNQIAFIEPPATLESEDFTT